MRPATAFLKTMLPQLRAWRHDFHQHPEIAFEEVRTSRVIAEKLESFGLEPKKNIGRTGVVATITGTAPGKVNNRKVGLRADIDALPMNEEGSVSYVSLIPGRFHGCGHDGHTTMLLGAAAFLAKNRHLFSGTVHCIFQPAEEGFGGAKVMIEDGLFEKFPCDEVYAMHNWPGMRTGIIDVQPGPRMASSDNFDIILEGKGGHAAMPHLCNDAVVASAQVINALQTMVSRYSNPVDPLVISITRIHAGSEAYNVIPRTVALGGTMRTFSPDLRAKAPKRMDDLVRRVAFGFEVNAKVIWQDHGFPPTINNEEQAKKALSAAIKTVGSERVTQNCKASMGAEDFSHMLEKKKGAYVFVGAGEKTAPLHHPQYDFNDELLNVGAELFVNMAMESLGEDVTQPQMQQQ